MSMTFSELQNLGLPPEVWSLIQRGLAHAGFYSGTYKGLPASKTQAAYDSYISGKSAEPTWMPKARKEIGTKAFSGTADNPDVVKYLKSVDSLSASDQRNDETAWCSAFVNWCMEEVGIKGTESAAARSWLKWGKKLNKPEQGCVVVLWRGSPNSWQGHVGFFIEEDSSKVYLLGGNQSDAVNISAYSKDRILDYRIN